MFGESSAPLPEHTQYKRKKPKNITEELCSEQLTKFLFGDFGGAQGAGVARGGFERP